MNRLKTAPAVWLRPLLAGALLVSAAFAQETAPNSAEKPSVTVPKTPFDAILELFGTSTPAADDKPTHPPAVVLPAKIIRSTDAVGTSSAPPTATTRDSQIAIQTDYSAAVREAQLSNRPLLVLLGARWCSWCRKLEAELEMPEAKSIISEWVVAEVDVDDEPEVAARLEAAALPGLRILGPFQSIVASREGYLELAELKQWLAENRKSADPTIQKVLYDTAEPNDEAIGQLITLLTDSSPMVRAASIERLVAHSRVSAGPVVQILKTGRLVQQLSACEVLRRWKAPVAEIDPWQPDTLTAEHFAPLIEWARLRMIAGDSQAEAISKPTSASSFDAQSAKELLRRLMKVEIAERPSLVAQLLGMGAPLATEVRSRLAHADGLDDSSRERLRELLYNLLASHKLRLEQSGVIAALARLDLESHRQAAATILEKVSIVDQPLVDELVRDTDPLVRELAVRALGRLGLMSDKDRVQQLLNDGNSNVRTAVLRVLTEHPSDENVENLCQYLDKETDEDLLVQGAKCMGQVPSQPRAMTALARLAANASWRVRATAIDAAAQAIQAKVNRPAFSAVRERKSLVPPELANAIVAAGFEHDAFVAERATKLLPSLIRDGVVEDSTLQNIAIALADHPDQLRLIVESAQGGAHPTYSPSATGVLFPPLVDVAKEWLAHGEPRQIQRAAILLSRLAPTELDNRVGELIASGDRAIRLAGLRAAAHSIEKYRETSIQAAFRLAAHRGPFAPSGQSEPAPWYDVPKDKPPQVTVPPVGAADRKTAVSASFDLDNSRESEDKD